MVPPTLQPLPIMSLGWEGRKEGPSSRLCPSPSFSDGLAVAPVSQTSDVLSAPRPTTGFPVLGDILGAAQPGSSVVCSSVCGTPRLPGLVQCWWGTDDLSRDTA